MRIRESGVGLSKSGGKRSWPVQRRRTWPVQTWVAVACPASPAVSRSLPANFRRWKSACSSGVWLEVRDVGLSNGTLACPIAIRPRSWRGVGLSAGCCLSNSAGRFPIRTSKRPAREIRRLFGTSAGNPGRRPVQSPPQSPPVQSLPGRAAGLSNRRCLSSFAGRFPIPARELPAREIRPPVGASAGLPRSWPVQSPLPCRPRNPSRFAPHVPPQTFAIRACASGSCVASWPRLNGAKSFTPKYASVISAKNSIWSVLP